MGKVEKILEIIYSLCEGKENNGLETSKNANFKPEDDDFEKVTGLVASLSTEEFNSFEERILKFVVTDWEEMTNGCLVTLEFIGDIFAYISSLTGPEVAERYSHYFSLPSMPPQIQLILYPAVVRVLGERDQDRVVANFETKFKSYLNTQTEEFNASLIAQFLSISNAVAGMCEASGQSQFAFTKMFRDGLKSHPAELTIILSSLYLVSIRSVLINDIGLWTETAKLINLLASETTQNGHSCQLKSFFKSSLTSYLSSIRLGNEKWLENIQPLSSFQPLPFLVNGIEPKKLKFEELNKEPVEKAPMENCLQPSSRFGPFGRKEKENNESKPSTSSASVSAPAPKVTATSAAGNGGKGCEKFLEMLEKLVSKGKSSSLKVANETERKKLEGLIEELNHFL